MKSWLAAQPDGSVGGAEGADGIAEGAAPPDAAYGSDISPDGSEDMLA